LLGVAGRAVLLDAVDVHLAGAGPNQRLDLARRSAGDDRATLLDGEVVEAVLLQVMAVAGDQELPGRAEVPEHLDHLLQVVGVRQLLALAIGLGAVVQEGEPTGVFDHVRPSEW
jgi:hypothetical protein